MSFQAVDGTDAPIPTFDSYVRIVTSVTTSIVLTSYQNREFNEWASTLFKRSQEGYQEGKPPVLRGQSRVLKVFHGSDALEDPSRMRNFGRDGYVYIFTDVKHSSVPKDPKNRHHAVEKLGGEDRLLQVHLMNEPHPEMSPSKLDKRKPAEVWYQATVGRIVDVALSSSHIALNTLDIPYCGVPTHSSWLDHAHNSYMCTSGTPFCPKETAFPRQLVSWLLFSTGNTIHSMHVDSNGLCTHGLTNGLKIWIFVVNQEEETVAPSGDLFLPFSSRNFIKVFKDPALGSPEWRLEAYVQRAGELLYVIFCPHVSTC
jgi:hypothetical protein